MPASTGISVTGQTSQSMFDRDPTSTENFSTTMASSQIISSVTSQSLSSTTLVNATSTTSDGTVSDTEGAGSIWNSKIALSCSPSVFQLGVNTTCTATLSAPGNLTGQVSFSSNSLGIFSEPGCMLNTTGGMATCTVSFDRTGTETGSFSIAAEYSGDRSHLSSSSSVTLVVYSAGSTNIQCSPSELQVGVPTYCIAAVVNENGLPAPTGVILFSSNGPGNFSQYGCSLDSSGECTVSFTPATKMTSIALYATYSGDHYHSRSSGKFSSSVT